MMGGILIDISGWQNVQRQDLRADRQPEFTQIDVELSFCNQDEVMEVAEKVIKDVFIACGKGDKLPDKFKKMSYKDAMEFYGTDKPDTRYDLKWLMF